MTFRELCIWLEHLRESLNLRGIDLRDECGRTVFIITEPGGAVEDEAVFFIGRSCSMMSDPFAWVPVRVRIGEERPEILAKIELAVRLVKA